MPPSAPAIRDLFGEVPVPVIAEWLRLFDATSGADFTAEGVPPLYRRAA